MSQGRTVNAELRDGQFPRPSPTIAAVGCIILALAWVFNPTRFFHAYLVAYNYWLGLSLGCLALLMLQHLTGGKWGLVARRTLEASSRLLPLLALLFLPVIFGLSRIYSWTNPEFVASEESLAHKSAYLNSTAFVVRAIIYFVIWIALSYLLNRWSREEDRGESPGTTRRLRMASGLGLVLYGLTITFASIDLAMSLEPLWYSTMFPPLFAVGQMLEGIAFATLVVVGLRQRLLGQNTVEAVSYTARLIPPVRLRDFGNLILVFVMFWAYLSFSQFLLIWAENLPEEIPWYLHRMRGGWQWVAMLLLTLQFAVPFLLLLSRDVKEQPRRLAAVALLVLAMRFIDLFWWVEASYGQRMSIDLLFDLAAWAGVGGIWFWRFAAELRRLPLVPLRSPQLVEALQEEAAHE